MHYMYTCIKLFDNSNNTFIKNQFSYGATKACALQLIVSEKKSYYGQLIIIRFQETYRESLVSQN